MTRPLALLLAVLAVLGSAACSPRRLPGTDVRETADTRAIYDVVDAYVKALNERDPAAILALTSADYFDDAGTSDPSDDLDRERLEETLVEDLSRVEGTKVAVTVRKIEVEGDTAFAELFYDSYYRVKTPAGPVPRRDSDIHRLRLKRTPEGWKITAGL